MSIPSEISVSPAELRSIGLFGALSDEVLVHLSSTLSVQTPESGEVVFREATTPTPCTSCCAARWKY